MPYIFLLSFIFFVWATGCHRPIEEYMETQPDISAEKANAFQAREVIPGMNMHEVELLLGEPSQKEQDTATGNQRWIYQDIAGVTGQEVSPNRSRFPQGISYVIPMSYECQELKILFDQEIVYRVEKILQTTVE